MQRKKSLSLGAFARLIAVLLPVFVALFFALAGHAQQIPSADQMQQLLTRQGGQNSGTVGQTSGQTSDILIQPTQQDKSSQRLLPPSRLEQILSSRAGARLSQFGYDRFGVAQAVLVPQTGAIQDDYVLGPGDEVVVSLRGQENNEFRTVVDRNGQVVLPRLNPIAATGRNFGSFREDVESAVRRAFVATSAFVSVGRVRQISVLVSGEVNSPGQRLVTGLSSAIDALLLSGGVKKSGSLRNVRIQRNGREYGVDLYNVLTGRGGGANLRLADGDRIIVPPLGPAVAVSGLVRRPGIYELAPRQQGMSVQALITLAGGQEVRGSYRLSLMHVLPDGQTGVADVSQNGKVQDSDILFVQLGVDQTVNRAMLSGSSGLAGNFSITQGTKLSYVLRAPGAMGRSPYPLFGIIVRKNSETFLRNLIAFTPSAVLRGKEDVPLQSDDLVKVISTNEASMVNFVVRSYLRRLIIDADAQRNPLQMGAVGDDGSSAEFDFISIISSDVQRNEIIALLDRAAPGTALARTQDAVRRQDAMQEQQALLRTQSITGIPAATVSAPSSSQGGGTMQNGTVSPSPSQSSIPEAPLYLPEDPRIAGGLPSAMSNSQHNGDDPLSQLQPQMGQNGQQNQNSGHDDDQYKQEPADNFLDQTTTSDRFAVNREAQTFGELSRQLGVDPLVLINFLVEHRTRLDGAVRGPGSYLVGPNVSLDDLVQAAGGAVNWADRRGVELTTTSIDEQTGRANTQRQTLSLGTGALANYVVRPRDQIRLPQVFADAGAGSITIRGQVRFPGSFPILRGEHLSDVLMRAGGLTNIAYPYGTIFLRKSAADTEREGFQRAASEIEQQLVVAMTRVGNDKIDPNTFGSMQSFIVELRNQRALGRISIVADPSVLASRPQLDPLLEAGDVVYIPQRPNTVAVLGQVMQPGNFPYRANVTVEDYVQQAGGLAASADDSGTFIVLPDGTARRMEKSWFKLSSDSLPPGSSIIVPRDVTPLDTRQIILDVSSIFSQFAIAAASLAVLSHNN